jgi:hypothetical protein
LSIYTDCHKCGHDIKKHREPPCMGGPTDSLGFVKEFCRCVLSQEKIKSHIATFDDRTCTKCGLGGGELEEALKDTWVHPHRHEECFRVMGKKIIELERELFSRRSAIRDQKERNGE